MKREILVVDDDRVLLKSLESVLLQAGYAVRTASNGEAAVESVKERRPDLVLLDVMMPGMDGHAACRALRSLDRSLPIIFLTALDSPENELQGLSCGADGYFPKTVKDELLIARIAAFLRLREGDDELGGDFDFANWRVEASRLRMVRASGRTELLTEREVAFLRLLASVSGMIFDRDAVMTRLWGPDADVSDNALSKFVSVLRQKLGRSATAIDCVRGVGYAYRP